MLNEWMNECEWVNEWINECLNNPKEIVSNLPADPELLHIHLFIFNKCLPFVRMTFMPSISFSLSVGVFLEDSYWLRRLAGRWVGDFLRRGQVQYLVQNNNLGFNQGHWNFQEKRQDLFWAENQKQQPDPQERSGRHTKENLGVKWS